MKSSAGEVGIITNLRGGQAQVKEMILIGEGGTFSIYGRAGISYCLGLC